MKILYVHGFGSKYDPTHEKIQQLETLGEVVGVDVDYCKGFSRAFETVLAVVLSEGIDLIVGTSMGGYMAAHVGSETGTPFVSLNPATNPSESLQKWVGGFVDYTGTEHHLAESVVQNYPDIVTEGCGLVLLDSGDEVINAYNTQSMLESFFEVHMFKGGGHRFVHMEKALPVIGVFLQKAGASYG